jgi:hypothetical protein
MQFSIALFALTAASLGAAQMTIASVTPVSGQIPCNGSIISTNGEFGDNNIDNKICCEGDPNNGVGSNGYTTCTAGTPIPMASLLGISTGPATTATATPSGPVSMAATTTGGQASAATKGSTSSSTGGVLPFATAVPLAGVAIVGGVLMLM